MTPFTCIRARWLVAACLLAPSSGCAGAADGGEALRGVLVRALKPPPPHDYTFARDADERRGSVPIHKDADWRVVYSILLEDLDPQERVAVRGEVQLTKCQRSDVEEPGPCKRITPFAPTFKVRIVLGEDADDGEGRALSATRDKTCDDFEHHCAVALDEEITGGLSGRKFANLAVAAVGRDPGSDDVMVVDEAHGGLAVTRIGQGADANGRRIDGDIAEPGWMKLDMANSHPRKEHITLQAEVVNVEPGDVLDVDAVVHGQTRAGGSKPAGCSGARDPLLSHQVFVSRHARDPIGSKLGAMTAQNGGNCKLDSDCRYRKSGGFELPRDAPGTVYVSVVSWGGRSCSASGDEWKLLGDSELRVGLRRDRAAVVGCKRLCSSVVLSGTPQG